MQIKKLIAIALTTAVIIIPVTSCKSNLDIPQKETVTLNNPYEFTYTKNGFTEETWEVTVTGLYAVGKTDTDTEGNCYVVTQLVTPVSTGNTEGTAQYSPDVEVLLNGKREDNPTLSNTCDFDQVRADGYTGTVEGVIGQEYKRVSVQYILNADLPKVTGIMLGALNSDNTFDDMKTIPLTEDDISDYPQN